MDVEKTRLRRVATLAHGDVAARETFRVCRARCTYQDGTLVRQRSGQLASLVPRGEVFGYDMIVHVGLQRFLFHRQREEIQEELEAKYGIAISTGSISTLVRRFLHFLEALHLVRAPALREALQSDGGWPLHVDATGEGGRGTLLVLFAGWNHWVLGASKIPTERADSILPCMNEVADRFGNPCSVMRDLGRAMRVAVAAFISGREDDIVELSCHLHFLKDVGKDLLDAGYGVLRTMLRRANVRARLGFLARELGHQLGTDIARVRLSLPGWLKPQEDGRPLPRGAAGLATVRLLTQWVFDFHEDSVYRTYPFDRPWLDLHDRCLQAHQVVNDYLRHPPEDPAVARSLRRLHRTLDAVASSEDLKPVVASLRMRTALHGELRDTLRYPPADPKQPGRSASDPHVDSKEELDEIHRELDAYETLLRKRRSEEECDEDQGEAIDLVLDHLERHGKSLFGHAIVLPPEAGGGTRLVARTNNLSEGFFHVFKQGERRRSGRKVLTQDFECLPAAAALTPNLRKADYVSILCGSLEGLPAAFAALDAERLSALRDGQSGDLPAPTARRSLIESASIPAADRRLVRSEALNRRIRIAGRS